MRWSDWCYRVPRESGGAISGGRERVVWGPGPLWGKSRGEPLMAQATSGLWGGRGPAWRRIIGDGVRDGHAGSLSGFRWSPAARGPLPSFLWCDRARWGAAQNSCKCRCVNNVLHLRFFPFLNIHISDKTYNSVIFLLDLFLTTSSASGASEFEIWENLVRNFFFEAFLNDGVQ